MFSELAPAVLRLALAGLFLVPAVGGQTRGQTDTDAPSANNSNEQPRLPDGRIDYLEILNQQLSEGVTTENNSVVLLLQALGPEIVEDLDQEDFLGRLGLMEFPADGPMLASKRLLEDRDPDGDEELAVTSRPWTKSEFPAWAEFLEQNRQALALVQDAALRPRYYYPRLVSMPKANARPTCQVLCAVLDLPNQLRTVARLFEARALNHIAEGNMAEAIEDLKTIHRLACKLSQTASLIEFMLAAGVDGIANDANLCLLESGQMTQQQIDDYRKFLKDNVLTFEMPRRFETERLMFLDVVQDIAHFGPEIGQQILFDEPPELVTQAMTSVDWEVVVKSVTQYDEIGEAWEIADDRIRLKRLGEIDNTRFNEDDNLPGDLATLVTLEDSESRSRAIGRFLMRALATESLTIGAFELRTITHRELLDLALVLESWRLRNGQFPDKLQQLVTVYADRFPIDRFSGDSLVYQPGPEGYRLYSIGPNGRDDGGLMFGEAMGADDVRIIVKLADNQQ